MTDDDRALLRHLVQQFVDLQAIVIEHQALIYAIQTSLSEQPGYNGSRFAHLLDAFRSDPLAAARQRLESGRASLQDLLARFEGPPQ